MRLDPKYFNLFIAICAALTIIAIVWSTFSYSQTQKDEFRENLEKVQLDEVVFKSYSEADSISLGDKKGAPVIIQFWSTWSGKSKQVHSFINDFQQSSPDLVVLSASVKDAEELIREYMNEQAYDFHYVEGTDFFQGLYVPGVPSSILIDRDGNLFYSQVGDDIESLEKALKNMRHEP